MPGSALVIGGGIFGVCGALELRRRGLTVTLVDPGPLPHPLAESTDISKVVRLDYGADVEYTALMERALDGWRGWNRVWPAPLFHETGVAFLARRPLAPGGFEHDSHALLTSRGHALTRLDGAAIRERYPAWSTGRFVDGYFNPQGGWAESGRVVAHLLGLARDAGVTLCAVRMARLLEGDGRILGAVDEQGARLVADRVVVAAGAWTPRLLPHLDGPLRAVGQPVFHLRPRDPARFDAARFPVFGADIATTGYYGFPLHPSGVVKIANHGPGRRLHPTAERAVDDDEIARLRAFIGETFPDLADAPIVATRLCVYGDSADEHFWIDRDPERPGLVIAAGGSGHGFKFAPVLGELIADAALGAPHPALDRFRYRLRDPATLPREAARHH